MDWASETMRATAVLLAASVLLVVPGTLGVGASALLALVYLAVAGGLYAVRDDIAEAPTALGHDVGFYGRGLWAAGVVAAVAVLLGLDGSAAELQAIGGLVGLAGMVNYFLRPVYYVFVVAGRYASGA